MIEADELWPREMLRFVELHNQLICRQVVVHLGQSASPNERVITSIASQRIINRLKRCKTGNAPVRIEMCRHAQVIRLLDTPINPAQEPVDGILTLLTPLVVILSHRNFSLDTGAEPNYALSHQMTHPLQGANRY